MQRVIHQTAKQANPFYHTLPRHLSFDEFKYKKGKLAFDYIDAKTGRILGILPRTTNVVIASY